MFIPFSKVFTTFFLLLAAAASVLAAPASPTKPAIAAPALVGDPASAPTDPLAADPEPNSIDCHKRYCESSTLWCFYWAGMTGYDVSLGPLPGETRTSVDTCEPATEVAPGPTVTIPPMLLL